MALPLDSPGPSAGKVAFYLCFWQQQDFPSLIINVLREMLKAVPVPVHMSSGHQEGSVEESLFQEHVKCTERN